MMSVERVCIVGNFASGKSHFAKEISQELGIPITHLDDFYWHSDWSRCTRDEFLAKYQPILEEKSWILDGSYPEFNLTRRFTAADMVFFLDMPFWFCWKQLVNRRSEVRDDFPVDEHQLKVSPVLGLVFILRLVLFRVFDRQFIMNAARHSKTPFVRIRKWADEDAALALCNR